MSNKAESGAQHEDGASSSTNPSEQPAPTITISIAIEPASYSLSQSKELPNLSITVQSHASRPITVFTFATVLNPRLALMRKNFYCVDEATGKPVWLERTKGPQRPAFRRRLGDTDEQYFLELQPEQPTTITCPFVLASGWKHRGQTGPQGRTSEVSHVYLGREYQNFLEPGHSYRFGIADDECLRWWRYGTKDEVLEPRGSLGCGLDWSEPMIAFDTAVSTVISITE